MTAATKHSRIRLNKEVFWISLVTLVGVTGALLVNPEKGLAFIKSIHQWMTHDLGWLFLGFVFLGVIWLGWLACSKFGSIVLGEPDEPPAYSQLSWFGMLFCAGIGSNLLYFGTTEWMGYSLNPPPLAMAEAGSAAALDWAGAYSFFHWGIAAWSTYAIATLPIAYMLHVKRSQTLRISSACREFIGERADGAAGKAIDVLFIFGLVGGVGTSLGVGVPMLSAVASELFGVERGMMLDTAILVGLTAVFSYSVSAGLDKGIKLLSDINAGLAILLLGALLFLGPTSFIINQAMDSLALMFQNYVEMSLRTNAGTDHTFVADVTVFFWAWWLAWAPFMGLFVARISRGRTIRQVILGCVFGGSVACWSGFSILGHSVMHLLSEGHPGLTNLVNTAKASGGSIDTPRAVVELLLAQPFSVGVMIIFFILSFIFVATSLDSAAFTLASAASENLPPDGQPPRWHRLTWAFVLAGTALSLMFLGGLSILQAASVVVGLPILGVMFLMIMSLMKNLASHSK